jgi:hypothetical protein
VLLHGVGGACIGRLEMHHACYSPGANAFRGNIGFIIQTVAGHVESKVYLMAVLI